MTNLHEIYLDASRYVEIEDREIDSEWDRHSTSTTWIFNHLSLSKGRECASVPFEPKVGQEYYALIATINTGDSFGRDDNEYIEVFGVYETEDEAYQAKDVIYKNQDNSTLEYNLPGGKAVKVGNPWDGYFESLGSLEVYPLTCRN